jgi:hypothetical protein
MYEDWHYWCRVALLGTPLVSVPLVGAYYRRHPSSMMATAPTPAVVKGHLQVMEVLCPGILGSDNLLEKHGEVLFWCAWAALDRARQSGASWQDLRWLAGHLQQIARRGPAGLSRSAFARTVRVLGVRWAEALRSLVGRGRPATLPDAPRLAG